MNNVIPFSAHLARNISVSARPSQSRYRPRTPGAELHATPSVFSGRVAGVPDPQAEYADEIYGEVTTRMQGTLTALAAERSLPVIG